MSALIKYPHDRWELQEVMWNSAYLIISL